MSRTDNFLNRTTRVELVTPVTGGSTVGVEIDPRQPAIVPVQFTVTRPADTTAYAVDDAISSSASAPAAISFSAGRTATGSGYIRGVTLQNSVAAATEVIEIDFYNASVTPINDNAEATRLIANKAKFLGTVILPALAKQTANSDQSESQSFGLAIPYSCAAGGLLYAIVRTAGTFTPVSAETFTFTVFCEQLS